MDDGAWNQAKQEAREILIARAKLNEPIAYSDLASRLKTARFEAHDQRLFDLLDDISRSENNAGRGMLSAFVIHKNPKYKPGKGFFELAKKLGRDVSDEDKFWVEEVTKVHLAWKK